MIDSVSGCGSGGSEPGCKEPPPDSFFLSLSLLVPHKSKNDYTCKYTGPRPRRQLCFTEMPLMFCLPTNRCAWKIANDPHVSPRLRAEKISLSHADIAISPAEMPKINELSFPRNLHVEDVLPLILAANTYYYYDTKYAAIKYRYMYNLLMQKISILIK